MWKKINILNPLSAVLSALAQFGLTAVNRLGAKFSAGLVALLGLLLGVSFRNVYTFECYAPDGTLRWREVTYNLVTTVGLNDLLTNYFKGSAYTAAFYVGLKNAGTPVAGDTMGSHASWTESSAYSNANRPTLTLGTVSAGSIDNSASKAVFNINATDTIAGAFVSSNNTKGGATGLLYGVADFASSRSVLSGDTLNVTVTLTATSG